MSPALTFEAAVQDLIEVSESGDYPGVVESYLNGLDEGTVLRLQTLMYFGRGDDTNLRRLHADLCAKTRDKRDAVRTIRDKLLSLADYLARGLHLAKRKRLCLDEEHFGQQWSNNSKSRHEEVRP